MNHQPFETWLLEETPLTPSQKRELQEHLQVCVSCAALAETGALLRDRRMVAAPAGFAVRFQERLAARRARQRQRRLWGLLLLAVSGVLLSMWLLKPVLAWWGVAPATWINVALGYLFFLLTSLHALAEIVQIALRFLPGFILPFFWMVLVSALAGFSLLWIVSIWRLSQRPRGV